MGQQVRESTQFGWSAARQQAAVLLAEDRLSDEAIAAEVGVSRAAITKWKRHPVFQERIQEHRDELWRAVSRFSIAQPRHRVRILDDHLQRELSLLDARSARYKDEIPGGDTGLMIPQVKIGGGGPDGPIVRTEWVRDDPGSEIRALLKQAAQELGQWSEKASVNHTGGIRREIVVITEPENGPVDVTNEASFINIEAELDQLRGEDPYPEDAL